MSNGRYLLAPYHSLTNPVTGQGLNPYLGNRQFGVWTNRDYFQAASYNIPTNGGDPSWSSVVFCCNMQPDIRSTTHYGCFYNEANNGQSAPGLDPICSSRNVLWGNFSLDANSGTPSGGLFCEAGTGWQVGVQDFTLEGWVLFEGLAPSNLFDNRPSGVANSATPLIYQSGSKLHYFVSNSDRIVGTTTLSALTWYHIAVARVSGNTKMFLNGTQEGSTFVDAINYNGTTPGLSIGNGLGFGLTSTGGSFSSTRYTIGVGRYSVNFTRPSGPFPVYPG